MSADSGVPGAAVEALRRRGTIEAIVILRRSGGLG